MIYCIGDRFVDGGPIWSTSAELSQLWHRFASNMDSPLLQITGNAVLSQFIKRRDSAASPENMGMMPLSLWLALHFVAMSSGLDNGLGINGPAMGW